MDDSDGGSAMVANSATTYGRRYITFQEKMIRLRLEPGSSLMKRARC